MTNLEELISLCKGSVSVTVNGHRDFYQTTEEAITEFTSREIQDVSEDIQKKMIETDTIISVYAYPNNAIGSYCCYHWDLNAAIDDVLASVRSERIS